MFTPQDHKKKVFHFLITKSTLFTVKAPGSNLSVAGYWPRDLGQVIHLDAPQFSYLEVEPRT